MDPKSFSTPGETDAMHQGTLRFLRDYTQRVQETLGNLSWDALGSCVEMLHQARLRRVQVFIAGNGGSAATASHMVNDLNKGAMAPGVPRFRALGLGDNVPLLTAWSNDASYDRGLVEPLRNLGQPGDLLVAISCSGNSRNVLEAVRYARAIGMQVIAFAGDCGGQLADLADLPVVVPNGCVEQIEDVHMFLDHLLVSALRERATVDLAPNLLLASGFGATPDSPAISPTLAPRPAILIDRDGVINANRADHVKTWDELELLPGVLDALRDLARLALPIVVITNQAAIARGRVSFEMVDSLNLRLMRLVAEQGGRIDAVASCPHHPDQKCACRKPQSGMLTYAAASLNLDLSRSTMIGDTLTDIQAARAAGARPILVRTGRAEEGGQTDGADCLVVADLVAAAHIIAQQESAHV